MPVESRSRVNDWFRAAARGVLEVACLTHAAAKFTGAQFVIPTYLQDSPVADLSGMDLTWAFFARSPLYSAFVAIGQLVAAVLLTFDRTARLGTVILLPITANIVVVNLGYDIGTDTLILSSVLLALNLYLFANEVPALKRCFWDETATGVGSSAYRVVIVRVAVFSAAAAGIFLAFTAIMNGPAGGQKAIPGDWVVESASVDGKQAADPAVGGDWLWISFDSNGRFGVRTRRYTFKGKYHVDPAAGAFTAQYDPEPLPPNYPGPQTTHFKLTDAEQRRFLGEQLEGFQWPVELTGTYQREGQKLIVKTMGKAGRVEWVLVPYKRPRF